MSRVVNVSRVLNHSMHAIRLLLVLTLLLGVIVPALFTLCSQILFPTAANGSLIKRDNKVVGSELIGQHFTEDKYFWGRLSATTPPYNAAASGSSNLSFLNRLIFEQANDRLAAAKTAQRIPVEFITASASGLDPHLSPEAVYFQSARVAKARKMSKEKLDVLIEEHIEGPYLGLIGVPQVNILQLNLALDEK